MTEVKKIAEKLTKDEAKCLRRLSRGEASSVTRHIAMDLTDRGLAQQVSMKSWTWTASSFGLAVARELEARDEGEAQ